MATHGERERREGPEDRFVEVLRAERQVKDVIVAYCQGVDRRDWQQVRDCYHDDAVDSHGAFVGDPDSLVSWLEERHLSVLSSMHLLTNVTIEVSKDLRSATSESYCLSLQVVDPQHGDAFAGTGNEPVSMTVAARFLDVFDKSVGAGWRIRRRVVAYEWVRRADMSSFVPLDPSWVASRRDNADALYDLFTTERTARRESFDAPGSWAATPQPQH